MAAKMRTKPTRGKRPKQGYLPDMEPPRIKAIDSVAETYYEIMMERAKLSKEESEAMDNLVEKMKEHGVDRYETPDGLVVVAISKTKCNVKRKKEADPEKNGEAHE